MSGDKDKLLGMIRGAYAAKCGTSEIVVLEGRNLIDRYLGSGGRLIGVATVGRSHTDLEGSPGIGMIERISADEAAALAGFPFHRGVIGLIPRPATTRLEDFAGKLSRGDLIVVCAGLGDPGNLGAIVRCAAAFGARGVVVGDTGADVFSRKALRGSAGSVFSLPVVVVSDQLDALEHLKGQGVEVVAADGAADRSVPLADFHPGGHGPLAVVLGNEGHGHAPAILDACESVIRIETSPSVESLNAACAAAVLLHTIRERVRPAPGSCSA